MHVVQLFKLQQRLTPKDATGFTSQTWAILALLK